MLGSILAILAFLMGFIFFVAALLRGSTAAWIILAVLILGAVVKQSLDL